jgi:hypothetical protein
VLDIECVIQYGICRDLPNGLQRCGRGGRAPSTSALFLILYEPWVKNTDISSLERDLKDPDQPIHTLTKTSKKPERTFCLQSPQTVQRSLRPGGVRLGGSYTCRSVASRAWSGFFFVLLRSFSVIGGWCRLSDGIEVPPRLGAT